MILTVPRPLGHRGGGAGRNPGHTNIMSTIHTPEPWEFLVNDNSGTPTVSIAAADGGCTIAILGDRSLEPDCPSQIDEADAERIVACVNACRGINPDAVPDLLSALRYVSCWLIAPDTSDAGLLKIFRKVGKAIIKATTTEP